MRQTDYLPFVLSSFSLTQLTRWYKTPRLVRRKDKIVTVSYPVKGTGIPQSTLSRIKSGAIKPGPTTLRKLKNFYHRWTYNSLRAAGANQNDAYRYKHRSPDKILSMIKDYDFFVKTTAVHYNKEGYTKTEEDQIRFGSSRSELIDYNIWESRLINYYARGLQQTSRGRKLLDAMGPMAKARVLKAPSIKDSYEPLPPQQESRIRNLHKFLVNNMNTADRKRLVLLLRKNHFRKLAKMRLWNRTGVIDTILKHLKYRRVADRTRFIETVSGFIKYGLDLEDDNI